MCEIEITDIELPEVETESSRRLEDERETAMIFLGNRMQKGTKLEGAVYLIDEKAMSIQPLSPSKSQEVANLAPGFSWGYRGEGALQLALAMLLEITDNPAFSGLYYGDFLEDFIEGLSGDCWAIDSYTIMKWIDSKTQKR